MAPPYQITTSDKFQTEDGTIKWEELEETAFDRIIASVHDFCLFMRNLFVPDDAILVPPENGWEEITKESFARLGKSDRAIYVLRHMTFIHQFMTGDGYQIVPEAGLCDWRYPATTGTIIRGDPEKIRMITETYDPAPPDFIGLCKGGRYCAELMLDCKYGIIHWFECPEGETKFGGYFKLAEWIEGDDARWGTPAAWPVEEFFEYVKAKFRSMEWLPRDEYKVVSSGHELMDTLREIYKRHGWPEHFQKADCTAELAEKKI